MKNHVRLFPAAAAGILGVFAVALVALIPTPVDAQVCGDGVVNPGETCDPPGSTPLAPPGNTNLCRADCTYCGDGLLQFPETCDTGGIPNRGCNPNCTGRLVRDPAVITFNVARLNTDRLKANGLILPPNPIDPTSLVIGVRLTNAEGLIYNAEIPAGAMEPVGKLGRNFKYRNRHARTEGGFSDFRFFQHKGGYRIKLEAYGDLSAATTAEMMIEVYFAHLQFVHSAAWKPTKKGWREDGR